MTRDPDYYRRWRLAHREQKNALNRSYRAAAIAARLGPQPPCERCGGEVITQTLRHSRFCSSNCRISAWRIANPDRARAISHRCSASARRRGYKPPSQKGRTVRVGDGLSVRISELPGDWREVARLLYETRLAIRDIRERSNDV